ncbi:hypothetical protein [Streptomyces fragilis]|nr:hypothetical protein [Streptomyces fragilis]
MAHDEALSRTGDPAAHGRARSRTRAPAARDGARSRTCLLYTSRCV